MPETDPAAPTKPQHTPTVHKVAVTRALLALACVGVQFSDDDLAKARACVANALVPGSVQPTPENIEALFAAVPSGPPPAAPAPIDADAVLAHLIDGTPMPNGEVVSELQNYATPAQFATHGATVTGSVAFDAPDGQAPLVETLTKLVFSTVGLTLPGQ